LNFALGEKRQYLHFAVTLVLLVLCYSLASAARLRLVGPLYLFRQMLPPLVAQAIFLATVLYALAHPGNLMSRLRLGNPLRFLFLVPLAILIFYLYDWRVAAMLTTGAIAILEFLQANHQHRGRAAASFLLPAAYFVIGFWVVYKYNDIIAVFRFYGAYDPYFSRVDSWLLWGHSVSEFGHWAATAMPHWFFPFLEAVYYGTFAQVGAGIILVGLESGMSRAFRLVGTILLAYYATVLCFFLWPSHGPYLLCQNHFATFPNRLNSYAVQQVFLENVKTLWQHTGVMISTGGYYISFPCMHLTQPLIVLWFLRQSKRMMVALAIYDAILCVAIVLLEWHYLVDLIGGAIVAAAAIWLVAPPSEILKVRPPKRSEISLCETTVG
jgi:hypothetical protein